MTPERIANLVVLWVRFYTRGLPPELAERRLEEIAGDLRDQIQSERSVGLGDSRIAFSISSRLVRGAIADAGWRSQHLSAVRGRRSLVRPLIGVLCVTTLLLSIPLIAMRFTEEVAWSPGDFIVAALLLGGTGFLLVLAVRQGASTTYRLGTVVGLGACLMLVWASLAVGIIGIEGDPADLMYAGVLGVGLIGAVRTRLRPAGLSRTLLTMALAQMLVAALALLANKHEAPASSAFDIIAVNAFFAMLFLASALLFWLAERGLQKG